MLPSRLFILPAVGLVSALAFTLGAPSAFAVPAPVDLGTAASFAVLAATTVTNTGATTVSGDVGVSPQTAVVGFPPGIVSNGTIHAADGVASQAQTDLTAAYVNARDRTPVTMDETGTDLGGQTLTAGVYSASTSMALTGTLTLDGQGDPNAVFIFQAGSTLDAAGSSTVALIGAAQACNVFWQVGDSATFGSTSNFVGSVLALTSITMDAGAGIQGRLLARNGAVTLDTNTITRPSCAVAPSPAPTLTATATATATPTSTPSPTSSSTHNPGHGRASHDTSPSPSPSGSGSGTGSSTGSSSASSSDTGSGSGSGSSSGGGSSSGDGTGSGLVPLGHPETGRPALDTGRPWLFAGVACLLGAGGAALTSIRRRPVSDRLE